MKLYWGAVLIFFLGLVGCSNPKSKFAPEPVSQNNEPTQNNAQTEAIGAQVKPSVELAMVLAALSPLGVDDENYDPIKRGGEYYNAVQAYFGQYSRHKAVTLLGEDFNMPRLVGNAADFNLTTKGNLKQTVFDGSMWDDPDNDLFRENLTHIQDFARVSNFRAFFDRHRPYYVELETAMNTVNDLEDMTEWLEANFSARPNRAEIYISMLLMGHHWTSGNKQDILRIWVNARDPDPAKTLDAVNKLNHARAVFTELDHPYVNPVSHTKAEAIKKAFKTRNVWGTENAWDNYSSAEYVFNEYMTYAVFLLYAQDRLKPEEFAALKPHIIRQMVERRGFVKFGGFADQIIALANDEAYSGRAESLIDPIIAWCDLEN